MGFRNRLAMCLAMCLILTSIPITAIADETDFIPNQCEVGYEYFSKKMNSPSDISEIECEEDASEAEQFVQEDAFSDELHINNEDFSLCTSGEGGELATSGEIAITETLYWGIHDFTLFISTFDQSSQSYVSGSFNSTEQWYYPNQKAPWSGSTFYNAVVGNPKANDIVVPRYTSAWFAGCQYVKTIDLQGLDTSRVLNMNQMFRGCYALEALDLSNFDTSASYSMSAMFSGCRSLKELDLSSFDTSKVTSMYTMFCQCAELTELDISSFDTSSVTDMYEMFWGCEKLESLDVSNFDTSKVTRMYYMFNDCKSLQELDLSNFDTSNVYDMHFMFAFLKSVKELDLSNFNTSKVTDMTYMFAGCEELCSLDISSFDTSMVTSNDGLFRFSGKLRELIKGEKTIFGNKLFEAGSGYLNVSSFWYDENGTQYWANDVGTAPAGKYIYALCDITWRDDQGNKIDQTLVPYGTLPVHEDPSKTSTTEGFFFAGWNPEIQVATRSTEYRATFKSLGKKYDISYTLNGGIFNDENPDGYAEQTETFTLNNPIKEGYTFHGWTGSGLTEPTITVTIPKGSSGNKAFTANWKINKYTITFDTDGGSVIDPITQDYGTPITVPDNPSKTGYTFSYWDSTIPQAMPAENQTIRAIWNINRYTVLWLNYDNSVLKNSKEDYGAYPTVPETPKKPEDSANMYSFSGWSPQVSVVDGDIAYVAQYTTVKKTTGSGSSSGSGGGGGGGGGGGAANPKVSATTATFSKFWYDIGGGVWKIQNNGQDVKSAWLCDDAVSSNGKEVWYLMNTDGTMLAAGLVQDNTGNFYSLETNHNGYFGMLRYKSGTYNCNGQQVYLEFSQKHDGSFGAVINPAGLASLKAIYGITKFGVDNNSCQYTSTFK